MVWHAPPAAASNKRRAHREESKCKGLQLLYLLARWHEQEDGCRRQAVRRGCGGGVKTSHFSTVFHLSGPLGFTLKQSKIKFNRESALFPLATPTDFKMSLPKWGGMLPCNSSLQRRQLAR
jgi:hypothetical protein